MEIELVLSEGLDFEKRLVIDGMLFDESIRYLSFKTALIDSEGNMEHCGSQEYFDTDRRQVLTMLFPGMMTENKNQYLTNDTLSLYFEYVYSTGAVSYQFCSCGEVSPVVMKVAVGERKELRIEQPSTQLSPSALTNDLKFMYKNGVFSDMELRTSSQTFPVHKSILSARSPVFRKMFSNDMKEKNSGHVDITDLEDDTMQLMLMYMYTDTVEDLPLENACKLYRAADKYEMLSLRDRCSSFLKDKLCPTKVCDVLVLADVHHDNDLKSAVQDFILKHDKEVFGSQKWRDFMDTNSNLAAYAMYRKVCPGYNFEN